MLPFLEQAWESTSQVLADVCDPLTSTCSLTALVLAAIWVFFRIVRTLVAVLFILCVVMLVLRHCFGIDPGPWLLSFIS